MTDESKVKTAICEWLDLHGALFTLHVRAGKSKYNLTSRFKRKGWPDIVGVWRDGKALMIEVKAGDGKISKEQMDVIEQARRLGAHAMIVYELNDVVKVLGAK